MITAFISYSHDSDEHKAWVLRLARRLKADGIDVRLDQDIDVPSEGFPKWMIAQLEASAFTIVVCSEAYVNGSRGIGGHGVAWETNIIYQTLYDSKSRSASIVPILRANEGRDSIPLPLRPLRHYRPDDAHDYEHLLRRLLGTLRSARLATAEHSNKSPRYWLQETSRVGDRIPRNIAAINNAGRLAGDTLRDNDSSHAFVQGDDLILSGDDFSFAYDLNDAGHAVGLSARTSGPVSAFVFRNGKLSNVSDRLGHPSVAYGINNPGSVVGSAFLNGQFSAFELSDRDLRLFETPMPAKRINDAGVVAGDGWTYEHNQMTHFGWGSYVNTYDINNLGEVVGQAGRDPHDASAFLYKNGKMLDLGSLGGVFARAIGINDRSEIVGYSTDADGAPRAFVRHQQGLRDLNSLVQDCDNWILEVASAINNAGQIAGSGRLGGEFRTFILHPLG